MLRLGLQDKDRIYRLSLWPQAFILLDTLREAGRNVATLQLFKIMTHIFIEKTKIKSIHCLLT